MAMMTAVRRQNAHTDVADAGEAAHDEAEQADEWGDEVPNEETLQAAAEVYAQIARGERGEMDIDRFFEEIEASA